MRTLNRQELQTECVTQLSLDPTAVDLSSPEAIAALLRRAASFNCPCTASTLISVVLQSLGVFEDQQRPTRDEVSDMLESVLAYGDLVEAPEITGTSKERLLYLAPPAYVEISPVMFLLIGIVPDADYPLPDTLKPELEYANHCRRLHVKDNLAAIEILRQIGFVSLTPTSWLKSPNISVADHFLSRYSALLQDSGPAGKIDDLQILDSQRSVGFYPGRWAMLKGHSGTFVARRPQPFGAPLWCYVRVENGMVKSLLDLPALETRWRPCDEAWHIQQAVDSVRGTPQRFKCRSSGSKDTVVVDFFSPVPLWARRRWDCVGTPVLPYKCLFSYSFAQAHLREELAFARDSMWLDEI